MRGRSKEMNEMKMKTENKIYCLLRSFSVSASIYGKLSLFKQIFIAAKISAKRGKNVPNNCSDSGRNQ